MSNIKDDLEDKLFQIQSLINDLNFAGHDLNAMVKKYVDEKEETPEVHVKICGDVSAQIRRAVYGMLPEIAQAVTDLGDNRGQVSRGYRIVEK